ncbi:MAG TPA: hypothetical protein VNJ11_14785 [Bryobacteraceae bacterium]|nr:hypothetical protein [Bryobacteraceae bacterium]
MATAVNRGEVLHQVARLTAHPLFHGAESLCKLLRYLAEHSMENPGVPLKEYQIATEVFGRPPDFDPRIDSIVRVQTGRLRSKLAEYYSGDGAEDPIVLEIPKGSYSLTVHHRAAHRPQTVNGNALSQARPVPHMAWLLLVTGLGAGLLVALLIAPAVGSRWRSSEAPALAPELRRFWGTFTEGPEPPLVVFSNAEFVGRPETGMRYFDPARDSREDILDHYTGVGEVMAVHELDRVFTALRHPVRVKRGRLLTWDEARNVDLIFIGSPSENLSLRELPNTQNFVFEVLKTPARPYDLAIVNRNPRPGERTAYSASSSLPVTEDYSIVSLLPGLVPARKVLVLAGTTTLGTQAAVEYVCRSVKLQELFTKLKLRPDDRIPDFEAVLQVKISGGVPVQSRIVALRQGKS